MVVGARRGRRSPRATWLPRWATPEALLSLLVLLMLAILGTLVWSQREGIARLLAGPDATVAQPAPEPPTVAARPTEPAPALPQTKVVSPLPNAETVAESATLYQEASPTDSAANAAAALDETDGTVVWRFQPAGDQSGARLVLDVRIPGRRLDVNLSMAENRDPALTASHIIEVIVRDSEAPVAEVGTLIPKAGNRGVGQPLIGASTRVAEGIHWIALSSDPNDIKFNTSLFRSQRLVDLPIIFEDGRRAFVTLEKGESGQQAISRAFAAWAER